MVKRAKTIYRRKLSAHEIRGRYILITKSALRMFSKVGKPFELQVKGKKFDVSIHGVLCTCMGPDKPHEHYRIDTSKFRDLLPTKGWTDITITKSSDRMYVLVSK